MSTCVMVQAAKKQYEYAMYLLQQFWPFHLDLRLRCQRCPPSLARLPVSCKSRHCPSCKLGKNAIDDVTRVKIIITRNLSPRAQLHKPSSTLKHTHSGFGFGTVGLCLEAGCESNHIGIRLILLHHITSLVYSDVVTQRNLRAINIFGNTNGPFTCFFVDFVSKNTKDFKVPIITDYILPYIQQNANKLTVTHKGIPTRQKIFQVKIQAI